MNNAQAALQAAATVYSGGRGHTTPASVKLLAETFKNWLDHQDQVPEGTQCLGPVPDHNGDPACNCGWNPQDHYSELATRADAIALVRAHIREGQ
jgi:hypothetical protein